MRTLRNVMFLMAALIVVGCGDDDDDDDDIITEDDVTTFSVTLTPAQEVPPCAAANPNATGTASISVADDDDFIRVNQLTFTDLSSPVTAAHIHQAPPGVAGPIVFPLDVNIVPFATVAFVASDFPSPVPEGVAPNFVAFTDAVRAGDTYINVHTEACPDGEIRAQIE
jgi:hypothetical protein